MKMNTDGIELVPVLNEDWVIKGTTENPRLVNLKTSKTIRLGNYKILEYICMCDGTSSVKEISEEVGEGPDVALGFYKQFVEVGAITFGLHRTKKLIQIDLGRKEPWLKEVHLDITSNCNLRCRHCFWGDNIKPYTENDFSNWEKVIKDLKNTGVARIVLSGGETLTSKHLLEFVKLIHRNNLILAAIFTNGTIWDKQFESVLDYIIKCNLFTTFYVSVDGYNSQQHDFIRGKGNYAKTVEFLKKIIKVKRERNANYSVVINSLIHRHNYQSLIKWYNQLLSIGVDRWRFTTGRITGSLVDNKEEIKVSLRDIYNYYILLIRYIASKYFNKENVLEVNMENYFATHMLDSHKIYIFNKDLNICDYKSNGCSIDPYGNMQFCTSWQDKKIGNVFTNNVQDVWLSSQMQKLKQMKISEISECDGCKYIRYCGGGCRLECKDLFAKDDFICDNFIVFDEFILPELEKLNISLVE